MSQEQHNVNSPEFISLLIQDYEDAITRIRNAVNDVERWVILHETHTDKGVCYLAYMKYDIRELLLHPPDWISRNIMEGHTSIWEGFPEYCDKELTIKRLRVRLDILIKERAAMEQKIKQA